MFIKYDPRICIVIMMKTIKTSAGYAAFMLR
jgi:hypothetical protein